MIREPVARVSTGAGTWYLVAPLYAGGGRPSVNPVVFLKWHGMREVWLRTLERVNCDELVTATDRTSSG